MTADAAYTATVITSPPTTVSTTTHSAEFRMFAYSINDDDDNNKNRVV